jgi:hypothetical protein
MDIITSYTLSRFGAMCMRPYDDGNRVSLDVIHIQYYMLYVTPVVCSRHSRFQEHKCGCIREI